jgi:hypothetical protein
MANRNFNTDFLSPERIWVEKEVDSMWYDNNDRLTHNSVEATIKFLQSAKRKAKKQGFLEVRVEPITDEGDEDNLPRGYIKVIGYRLETDKEYKYRVECEVGRMERGVENIKRTKLYHESEDFAKRLKLWKSKL